MAHNRKSNTGSLTLIQFQIIKWTGEDYKIIKTFMASLDNMDKIYLVKIKPDTFRLLFGFL